MQNYEVLMNEKDEKIKENELKLKENEWKLLENDRLIKGYDSKRSFYIKKSNECLKEKKTIKKNFQFFLI